jgi:hypothetical protein
MCVFGGISRKELLKEPFRTMIPYSSQTWMVFFQRIDTFSDMSKDLGIYEAEIVWSHSRDSYEILQKLVPAMKPGAKIAIHEFVLPDSPEIRLTETIGL